MQKHTPGPWKAIKQGHVRSECDLQLVAVAQHSRNGEANAHLIAAAPELLEALLKMRSHVVELCAWANTPLPESTMEKASAAIAKATGAQL